MTNNYNRRDVIKKSSAVGVLASPILNSNLNKPPSTRVIEAALTYDIQNEDNYERFHTDSRPPYTIDHSKQQLVPLESPPITSKNKSTPLPTSPWNSQRTTTKLSISSVKQPNAKPSQ